jgi:hypothetical protein
MFASLKAIFRKRRTPIAEAKSMLYSSPSINDAIGPVTRDTTTVRDRIVIEPDNWRHTELAQARFSQAIDEELADISTIHRQHRHPAGWDKVHIRKRIPEPILGAGIFLPDLVRAFPGSSSLKGVGYFEAAGVVDDSFAFTTAGGLKLYGQTRPDGGEQLRSICFEPCSLSERDKLRHDLTSLLSFAAPHRLRLVCWNKLHNLEPDVDGWLRFFETQYHE